MTLKEFNLHEFGAKFFYKEPKPFTSKREINWEKLTKVGLVAVLLMVGVILLMPTKEAPQTVFHEKIENGLVVSSTENNPTQDTVAQLESSNTSLSSVHGSLDQLYVSDPPIGGGRGGSSQRDRNASMILSRSGGDAKSQLSPGIKFALSLNGRVVVTNQAVPVISIVQKDVENEGGLAIPRGSKVIGDISFDPDSEEAIFQARSIILPDGRERPLSAQSEPLDGNVKSDGVKNAVGQTMTRFIGAYAQGSMQTGAFGANQGGHVNGVRNAIGATAQDRANAWAEDLKKTKKWIEISSGQSFMVILSQPFVFKEPGANYGG